MSIDTTGARRIFVWTANSMLTILTLLSTGLAKYLLEMTSCFALVSSFVVRNLSSFLPYVRGI